MISSIRRRVPAVQELVRKSGRDILVGVDDGLARTNIAQVAEMGMDVLVSGSAVFAGDAEVNVRAMLREVADARPVGGPC